MNNYYDVWFSTIDIGNKVKLELLENFNSKDIYSFKKDDFKNLNISEKVVNQILNSKNFNLNKYYNYLEKYNIKVVCFKDEEYPDSLKNIDNMPAILYIRGNLENLYSDNVAIIGSRNATEYGKYVSRKIAKELSDRNINIVSRTCNWN